MASLPGSDYVAYGLRFRSEFTLPFRPGTPEAMPDVTIRVGSIPKALPKPVGKSRRPGYWEAAPGALLMNLEEVARYLISDGRDILIEPAEGGRDHDVGLFLVGSVMGALLQQRGFLTLHASAIETSAGAVLFMGNSGVGKSTLLAAMVERGYAMIADDVTCISLDSHQRPLAWPAFPRTRLWADAVDKLGWRARARQQVREGMDKYLAPVERFRAAPLTVRAAYVLRPGNRTGIVIAPAQTSAATTLLLRNTYRRQFLHGLGQRREHFRVVAAMAKCVPVARITRPTQTFQLDELADRIGEHLREESPVIAGLDAAAGR